MTQVTLEAIKKLLKAELKFELKAELEPIKQTLAEHTEILEYHSQVLNQHSEILESHSLVLDKIALNVKNLDDTKSVSDSRLERLENWAGKVGNKVKIKLEF